MLSSKIARSKNFDNFLPIMPALYFSVPFAFTRALAQRNMHALHDWGMEGSGELAINENVHKKFGR
jgi:hypothetical protein